MCGSGSRFLPSMLNCLQHCSLAHVLCAMKLSKSVSIGLFVSSYYFHHSKSPSFRCLVLPSEFVPTDLGPRRQVLLLRRKCDVAINPRLIRKLLLHPKPSYRLGPRRSAHVRLVPPLHPHSRTNQADGQGTAKLFHSATFFFLHNSSRGQVCFADQLYHSRSQIPFLPVNSLTCHATATTDSMIAGLFANTTAWLGGLLWNIDCQLCKSFVDHRLQSTIYNLIGKHPTLHRAASTRATMKA